MATNACPQGPISSLKLNGAVVECPSCGRTVPAIYRKVGGGAVFTCGLCGHEWTVKR